MDETVNCQQGSSNVLQDTVKAHQSIQQLPTSSKNETKFSSPIESEEKPIVTLVSTEEATSSAIPLANDVQSVGECCDKTQEKCIKREHEMEMPRGCDDIKQLASQGNEKTTQNIPESSKNSNPWQQIVDDACIKSELIRLGKATFDYPTRVNYEYPPYEMVGYKTRSKTAALKKLKTKKSKTNDKAVCQKPHPLAKAVKKRQTSGTMKRKTSKIPSNDKKSSKVPKSVNFKKQQAGKMKGSTKKPKISGRNSFTTNKTKKNVV